ncbi:hypothetical protein OXX80_002153 [Metschnikowia pulcherrima]
MPFTFDAGDFSEQDTQRPGEPHHTEPEDGLGLVSELKLALVGNRDLKCKLLRDTRFCVWFETHLNKCVGTLVACDITVGDDRAYPGSSDDNTATGDKCDGQDSLSQSALIGLADAIIVLRLLLANLDGKPESDIEPPSILSLEKCVPILFELIKSTTDAMLPDAGEDVASWKYAESWVQVSPILCDTLRSIMNFTEQNRLCLSPESSQVLWTLLSRIFLLYSQSARTQRFLAPVLLEAFNLLPLLLENSADGLKHSQLDSARVILSHSTRFLEVQLSRMFASYLPGAQTSSDGLPAVTLDMESLEKVPDFNIVSVVLVATAQILNSIKDTDNMHIDSAEYSFLLSEKFQQCLLPLFYSSGNYILSVATLNLLQYRLQKSQNTHSADDGSIHRIFENMFPRIVELLSHETRIKNLPRGLRLPISVLSDICLNHPGFCAQLKNTGVDKKIMDDLARSVGNSSVLRLLQRAKASLNKTHKITDFTLLRRNVNGSFGESLSDQGPHLSLIASQILLLSVLTSSNEEFRRRITSYSAEKHSKLEPSFLCLIIFEIVENYNYLCAQLLLNTKVISSLRNTGNPSASSEVLEWANGNICVLLALLEHPLYTNTLYLIRSLSRSVSTLRTFFVDANSIASSFGNHERSDRSSTPENVLSDISARYDRSAQSDSDGNFISCFLKIVKRLDDVESIVLYFASGGPADVYRRTRKCLIEKKVMILAITANFILDFSSFRAEIVGHDKFLKCLATLLRNSIRSDRDCGKTEIGEQNAEEKGYEQLKVQLGVLQIIKNYLYNETEDLRKKLWDFIPFAIIFDLSLYGITTPKEIDPVLHKLRLQQKIIAFEIMRNLTAASSFFGEEVANLYLDYISQEQDVAKCPKTWNKYLLANLTLSDLFLEPSGHHKVNERSFLEDDEYTLKLLKDVDYTRLVVAINYLEDHRYTNLSSFRVSNFPHRTLLRFWKRLLGIRIPDTLQKKLFGGDTNAMVKLCTQVNEIKVSIAWILINLTWKGEEFEDQVSESTNFRLMDIIRGPSAGISNVGSTRSLSPGLRETDGNSEGRESIRDVRGMAPNEELTPRTRAKILYRAGFCRCLEELMNVLNLPRAKSGGESQLRMERFDVLGSNDLYEKCKTAQEQISSLVSRSEDDMQTRSSNHRNREALHPLRRLSNIAGSRERMQIRRDVNRGGEGFGYSSDEEYISQDPAGSMGQDQRDTNLEEEEPMAEDDEFDEYWIR